MLNMENWPRLEIEEGHNQGACFWIQPVRLANENEADTNDDNKGNHIFMGVVEHKCQEISIDEYAVELFLWSTLKKYYDEFLSVQYRNKNSLDFTPNFEWYLTHNVYTYETVKKMIAELRETAKHLRKNDKAIAFSIIGGTPEEQAEGYRLIADFYERLCDRIEKMMTESPEFENISFMGP